MGYVYSDGTDYDADYDDGVQVVKPTPSAQATPPYIRNPGTSNNSTTPKQPSGSDGSQEPRPRAGRPHKPPPRGGKAGWVVLGLLVVVVGGGIYWAATQGIQMATDAVDDAAGIITETVDGMVPDVERAIGTAVDTVSDAAEGVMGDPDSIADAVIGMLPEAVGPYVLQVDDDTTVQSPEQPTGTAPLRDSQPQSPLDRTIWPTSPATASSEPDTKPSFIEQVENHVHDMTNGERASHGIRFLASDNRLDDIARNHSQDMANRGYFDHDTPEGLDPTDRGAAVSYNCRKDYGSYYTYGLAENIFTISWAGSNPEMLARQIVDSWMGSPGHRQNILESDYNALGVGIAVGRTGAVYATQNFC